MQFGKQPIARWELGGGGSCGPTEQGPKGWGKGQSEKGGWGQLAGGPGLCPDLSALTVPFTPCRAQQPQHRAEGALLVRALEQGWAVQGGPWGRLVP